MIQATNLCRRSMLRLRPITAHIRDDRMRSSVLNPVHIATAG
jgi:hypothetical protein